LALKLPMKLHDIDDIGLDGDMLEAQAFAYLAAPRRTRSGDIISRHNRDQSAALWRKDQPALDRQGRGIAALTKGGNCQYRLKSRPLEYCRLKI